MTPPDPKSPARRKAFWREPLVIRSVGGLLLIALLVELFVIGRHFIADAPVRAGRKAAAQAERSLGAGPVSSKGFKIDYAHVDERARQLMQRRDMVGFGIAIVEKGQLSFIKGYGETQAGKGDPVTAQTLFRWASVSKGVAATMVALLDEQGKLSLHDPVSKWSDSIKLPKDNQNVATLADALSHQLGIVKNAYDDRLEGNEDPRQIRGELGGLFPMCQPGHCFNYQNVAYDLVHEAIEKATHESYDAAAHQLIFRPLGMTSANTTREGLFAAKSWARPHDGRRTLPVEEAYYRIPAAGGMNSSIIDLGIWMRAQMGGALNVLDQKLLFELHVPRVMTPRKGLADYDLIQHNNAYGLGFRQTDYDGHHLIGHRGAVRGYRSMILFDPVEKVGVAMLWNSQAVKPTGMGLEIFDQFYGRPSRDWMQLARP